MKLHWACRFREQCFAWQPTSINYLAGSIAFFPFGLVMWLGTIPVVRRNFFKVHTIPSPAARSPGFHLLPALPPDRHDGAERISLAQSACVQY